MQKLIPYLILIGFLAALVASAIYMARRFTYMFDMDRTLPFYLVFSLLPVFFLFATGLLVNATGAMSHYIYQIASVVMGLYLFALLALFAVDLVHLFYKLKPEHFRITVLGLLLLITGYGYWSSTHIRNTEFNIPIKGLQENVTAVHLSDIHIGHFRLGGFLNEIVEKTNAANPDVVFITGDYLDSKYALEIKHFEPLKNIKAPVYFVDGNHDHSTNQKRIMEMMREVGVHVLENELAEFKGIQIIGLTHMLADSTSFDAHASENMPTVAETIEQLAIDPNRPNIVLHHAPNGIKYASKANIDLYLAGHTHAGQIFPFNIVANWMFEFNRGLNQFENTAVVVSEGIGTFGPPFRLGTKSEVIRLKLIPQ